MTLDEFEEEHKSNLDSKFKVDSDEMITKLIKLARAAQDRDQERPGSAGALYKAVKEVFGDDT